MRVYVLIMVLAAVITYLLVPLMHRMSLHIGAMTELRERDIHRVPVARLGGIAMYAGFVLSLVIATQIPYLEKVLASNSSVWAIVLGAGLMCLLGVIDDIWELAWYAKLAGQVLAAGVMAWLGVQLVTLPLLGLTVGSTRLTLFVTIIAVVVVVNAVNFIDGLDGLAAGIIGIAALAFLFYAYYLTRETSPGDYTSFATATVAALVGACAGFLPHNFHPARIFMGDSGSMMLGTVISGATIIITGQIDPALVSTPTAVPAYLPLIVPLVILAIPLVDLLWGFIRRIARGKSPFSADTGHVHYRLIDYGFSHTRAVVVLYMWTALLSFTVVAAVVFPVGYVIPVFVVCAVGAFFVSIVIYVVGRRRAARKLIQTVEDTGARENTHVVEEAGTLIERIEQ
ncbi:MAG: undecaprenyl/decaprenyl-phosphate alpha-N-acetylglucosaminyl 1-phosphate transferase [Actinomycetaceae bacterium]|nr:undecaprenyl/decaprenyl-phosphate alpha-N-acetylglucosaminyl 1-phosphate transferase [Actinomycetaceae bacterium]